MLITSSACAALTPEQEQRVRALDLKTSRAAALYGKGSYRESAKLIGEVQRVAERLLSGADRELALRLETLYRRVSRAHALLEIEGIKLPPLKPFQPVISPKSPSSPQVGFTKHIAPLLVTKCGRCHVSAERGEFSMATYPDLMRGSAAGVVIFPGDADGSRIVEVIESGDMPRGGRRVTPEEVARLKQWIRDGARFDGDDRRANLSNFARAAPRRERPMPSQPAGQQSVSFAREIAPALGASCLGCHVNAQRPRGRLDLSSYAALLRGGDSGAAIIPGEPSRSLLVQRLKGEGGEQRMPAGNRPPLSERVIAKVEKWIEEGAGFDGPDVNQSVIELAAVTKARDASHQELSDGRARLAARNWQLGMGDMPPAQLETENFLLLSNLGASTLQDYGQRAEKLATEIKDLLGAPADQPLIKGRMTLFLFQQRYDYSEFGQMVEERPLPKERRGHWRYSVVDAYAALVPPRGEDYRWDGLVGQQIAATYVASLGAVPRWFAEGAGRVVATKLAPREPRVAVWAGSLPAVLSAMRRPDDFLSERLPVEAADIASYSFMSFLMDDMSRFTALLAELRRGGSFEASFGQIYRADPTQLTQIWARRAAAQIRRRRR